MAPGQGSVVERQVHEWLARRRRFLEQGAADGPVITVSRSYASLGTAVAARVSGELGWELWNKRLVNTIAERAQVEPRLVHATEARELRLIREVADVLMGNPSLDPNEYMRRLGEVVAILAAEGGAVLLGRGTNLLLGPRRALRVRVDAPMWLRVARVVDQEGVSPKEAERIIRRHDQSRARWVRDMVGGDVGEPTNYDIVISTEALDVEQAVHLVLAAWVERRRAWAPDHREVPRPGKGEQSALGRRGRPYGHQTPR